MANIIKYTTQIGIEICAEIASSNKSLATICTEMGLSNRTAWYWISEHEDFREMYEKAKMQQADFLIEEMMEIADQGSKDLIDAMDRKLRVNTRQWAAAKLKPKKYGQNSNVDVTIDVKRPMTPEQFNKFLDKVDTLQLSQETEDVDYEDVVENTADNDENTAEGAEQV